jgi:hypothetical protein
VDFMLVIGLIAAFCLIFLLDLPGLLKTNHRVKTLGIYIFLLAAGFVMSLLQVIEKAPPSPVVFIEKVVRSIFY